MQLSVSEFAEARGVSRQRALALISAGQVKAQRVGRSWVIDQQEVNRRAARGRPLSARMAELIIHAMSGDVPERLDPQERFFLGKYVDRLRRDESPLELLHSWLRSRQIRVVDVGANPADIPEIAADRRAVASGISDPRAGMSAAREFEGYIEAADLERFLRDNLLVESASLNVRLHVVGRKPADPVPLGLIIADLADWNRPREDGRALDLMRGVSWPH
ncbi:helix-turn-helix domain-containing protein [Lysinimonas soli]|uniref:Helix-turn-helix domain-containing protein n=1 Tax=Lysinimonas soli TaxID=1074233 RepID=A0ABW0NWA3_9MICO